MIKSPPSTKFACDYKVYKYADSRGSHLFLSTPMFTMTSSKTTEDGQDEAQARHRQTEDAVRLDRILKPILILDDHDPDVDCLGESSFDQAQFWRENVFRVALEGFTENIWLLIVVVAFD